MPDVLANAYDAKGCAVTPVETTGLPLIVAAAGMVTAGIASTALVAAVLTASVAWAAGTSTL